MSAAASLRSAVKPVKCQYSTARAFSSSCSRYQVLPESPRFIDVPEPPQQNYKPKPVVKGFLPPPREVFPGKLETEKQLHRSLWRTARLRRLREPAEPGSREEWDIKLSTERRRNLLEGSIELRLRKEQSQTKRDARTKAKIAARETALHQAMREDERLTLQSNNFDLEKLKSGRLEPGNAKQLSAEAKARHDQRHAALHEQRLEHLHDLYNKARSFIVTKEQLDKAIEESFGTAQNPVIFETEYGDESSPHSVWAYGRPDRLQDRLNFLKKRSTGNPQMASNSAQNAEIQTARITRIAEQLTGGSLGENMLEIDDKSKPAQGRAS